MSRDGADTPPPGPDRSTGPDTDRDTANGGRSFDQGSLEALLESARLLHGSLDLDELLRSLLRSVMGRLVVSRALLALADDDGTAHVAVSRGFKNLPAGSPFDPTHATDAGVEHLLPMGDPGHPTGYLGLGRRLAGAPGERETEFLQALLGIAATAVDNARSHERARRLNRQLNRRLQQLGTLLDLVRSLTSTLEPPAIAQILSLTLAGQWLVRRSAVHAWRDGHPPVARQLGMSFAEPRSLEDELATLGAPARVEDLPQGELRTTLEAQGARLVVPLLSGERALGFAALGDPAGGRTFGDDDLTFCAGLAAQAAVAFENAWYFTEAVRRETLDRDLRLAGEIQARLFPEHLPQPQGWRLAARNRPASAVGGDYYDVLPVGDAESSPFLLCIADVSGKGMAAALLMSNLQAALRALVGTGHSLVSLVTRLNHLLHRASPGNKFVTALFVLVDPANGHCRYVNAGHNEGLVARAAGTLETLPSGGMPLGLFAEATFHEAEVTLAPGDLLLLYTDGINEAENPQGQELGDDRLQQALLHLAGKPPEAVVEGLFQEVDTFAREAPQHDDITLVALGREG